MAYEKQNFLDGQIVTADHLNHMENGIIAAQKPRNLLDNSDFANPVNQRGASSYSGWVYGIDRWTAIGPYVNVSLGSGITVTITASSTIQYGQYLSDEAWNRLKGKPFTFALCTSDGAIHIATGTMTSGSELYDSPQIAIGSSGFKMNLYKDQNARPMVRIFAFGESTITILWAALYEGAYTADTLPTYVPKGYAAELLECLRYYRTLNVLFGTEIGSVTRQIINFTPAMRIIPTSSAAVTSGSSSTASATINVASDRYIDISTNSWGNALVTLSADL